MKQQLKTIQLIHASFCVAVFAFAIVAIVVNQDKLFFLAPKELEGLIFPIITILSGVLSRGLFNKLIGNIDPASNANSKLIQYQTAFLVKCALLEAGALANIVACLIDGNLFFLLFAGINFVTLVMARPTVSTVAGDLCLQESDIL